VEETLFPSLVGQGRPVLGYTFEGVWADIGTPSRYLDLVSALLDRDGLAWHGPDARVEPGATVDASDLGAGTHVAAGADVSGTIVWENVHIGAGAKVRASILADGVTVGEGAVLDGVVAGSGATIRPSAVLGPGTTIEPGATAGGRE
jgi:mannose-1-phosphate guanylyltransferase